MKVNMHINIVRLLLIHSTAMKMEVDSMLLATTSATVIPQSMSQCVELIKSLTSPHVEQAV